MKICPPPLSQELIQCIDHEMFRILDRVRRSLPDLTPMHEFGNAAFFPAERLRVIGYSSKSGSKHIISCKCARVIYVAFSTGMLIAFSRPLSTLSIYWPRGADVAFEPSVVVARKQHNLYGFRIFNCRCLKTTHAYRRKRGAGW